VVLTDANVLLYAVDTASPHHRESFDWLERSLAGAEAVGFAWVVLLAFLRVGTNRSILPNAWSVDDATSQVQNWLAAPAAVVVEPTARHPEVLRGLLLESGAGGNLISDAHVAALAIEHGADLVSYDRDFARFRGLRHRLPSA
jgi:toxin-antitoxin system PIN domain toxin